MNPNKPVRMCVCAQMTFRELKALGVTSIQEAQDRFDVCVRCQTCEPYLQQMFVTGEVEFAVIKSPDPA